MQENVSARVKDFKISCGGGEGGHAPGTPQKERPSKIIPA